jgi:hypothetical protein
MHHGHEKDNHRDQHHYADEDQPEHCATTRGRALSAASLLDLAAGTSARTARRRGARRRRLALRILRRALWTSLVWTFTPVAHRDLLPSTNCSVLRGTGKPRLRFDSPYKAMYMPSMPPGHPGVHGVPHGMLPGRIGRDSVQFLP